VSGQIPDFRIDFFADTADARSIRELAENPLIKGFTTNPTLMRAAGVTDYETFGRELVRAIPDRAISFEVFADDFDEMEHQALRLSSWGEQIYVKIPITNTRGEPSTPLLRSLTRRGVKVNVTAILTLEQVREVSAALADGSPSLVSVFAGRIADTGRDPVPVMAEAVEVLRGRPEQRLLWASTRELYNVVQADRIGCDVITVTPEILRKLAHLGKPLDRLSLETVRMFREDALRAGFTL
jgi:transaldolase